MFDRVATEVFIHTGNCFTCKSRHEDTYVLYTSLLLAVLFQYFIAFILRLILCIILKNFKTEDKLNISNYRSIFSICSINNVCFVNLFRDNYSYYSFNNLYFLTLLL